MKKNKALKQLFDMLVKISIAFVVVFIFYCLTKFINSFAYDYFIFPFCSIIIIFICGISVGKTLERIKNNESTGIFTTKKKNNEENETEFIIENVKEKNSDKKVIKQDEEKIHIKTYDIDEELEKMFLEENR